MEVDRTISFTQLAPRVGDGVTGTENLFDLSLSQALGTVAKSPKFDFASSKLGKVNKFIEITSQFSNCNAICCCKAFNFVYVFISYEPNEKSKELFLEDEECMNVTVN